MTTLMPDAVVMTAKDYEEACKQPLAIATAVSMVAMILIHAIGMFAWFTKLNTMFNPSRVRADVRRQAFTKRVMKKF